MKKIHRFLYEFSIVDGYVEVDDNEIVNQIKNVLRLSIGESIVLFFNGHELKCFIFKINKNNILLKVENDVFIDMSFDKNIILYCSILKKDNFELVVQKATEIGIKKIVPVITERTIKTDLNFDRLDKITKEASEQSGRSDLVSIEPIIKFKDCISNSNDLNILFDFTDKMFKDFKIDNNINDIGFFIGPEGGFTEKEVSLAKDNGFEILRLGENVLKAETAAIVASYLLVNL